MAGNMLARYETACMEVNPSNPVAAAEAITGVVEAAKQITWKLSHEHSAKGDGSDCTHATIDRRDITIKMLHAALNLAIDCE